MCFLGWSLAAAIGLPLITFMASHYGWRAAYGGVSVIGALSFLLLLWRLPSGLRGAPVDLKTWADLGRNRVIIVLLAITTLLMSGQFAVFTYMGPILSKLTQVGANSVGLVFAIYGVCGFIGIVIVSNIVDLLGRVEDVGAVHLAGAGRRRRMGALRGLLFADGVFGGGLGPRLCLEQLDAAGAACRCGASAGLRVGVAQPRRFLYVGQAIGSGIGGALYAHDLLYGIGYAGAAFVALALITVIATRNLANRQAASR